MINKNLLFLAAIIFTSSRTYRFFLSPNKNLLKPLFSSYTEVISIIDSFVFHPPKVVISLSWKKRIPSPADEQMYLLHFVTSSLLMYYWWPMVKGNVTFQRRQQKASLLRPYFNRTLLTARNNQLLRLVEKHIVQGTVTLRILVHRMTEHSLQQRKVSHHCIAFVLILIRIFQQVQSVQFEIVLRSTDFSLLFST